MVQVVQQYVIEPQKLVHMPLYAESDKSAVRRIVSRSEKSCVQLCTEADDGQTIVLYPGDTLKIELRSNPTTGYTWFPVFPDTKALELIEDRFYGPASQRPGAGGTQVYIFRAVSSTEVRFQASYERPWLKKATSIPSFTLNIVIKNRLPN